MQYSALVATENKEHYILHSLNSFLVYFCLIQFIIACNITWTFFSDTSAPSSFLPLDDSGEPS